MEYKTYEDNILISLARDKNEKALRELIDRYNYLILGKARVYNLISYDFDDILQEDASIIQRKMLLSFKLTKVEDNRIREILLTVQPLEEETVSL